MAITETRNLPAPFIQSLGEYYGKELPALTKDPMETSQWAPTIAGSRYITNSSSYLAGTQGKGIGAFEDYISNAQEDIQDRPATNNLCHRINNK